MTSTSSPARETLCQVIRNCPTRSADARRARPKKRVHDRREHMKAVVSRRLAGQISVRCDSSGPLRADDRQQRVDEVRWSMVAPTPPPSQYASTSRNPAGRRYGECGQHPQIRPGPENFVAALVRRRPNRRAGGASGDRSSRAHLVRRRSARNLSALFEAAVSGDQTPT